MWQIREKASLERMKDSNRNLGIVEYSFVAPLLKNFESTLGL